MSDISKEIAHAQSADSHESPALQANTSHEQERKSSERAFTGKAIFAGFLGGLIVCLLAGFSDEVLSQTLFIGNHIPFSVLSYVMALICIWNPLIVGMGKLWTRLKPKKADTYANATGYRANRFLFSPKETVVVLALTLAACWAPTSGLHRYFARLLIIPYARADSQTGWPQSLTLLPEQWFPEGAKGHTITASEEERMLYARVYESFITGDGRSTGLQGSIGINEWPWQAWLSAMARWTPLIACFALGLIALYAAFHRQWARHEQLPYPIAAVSASFLDRPEGKLLPAILYSKLFWIATTITFAIHALRITALYHEGFPHPDQAWWIPWTDWIPSLWRSGTFNIQQGRLLFCIIGLVYFLPGETGLTVGLSQFLLAFIAYYYYNTLGKPLSGNDIDTARLGSYLAYGCMFLYIGRTWYLSILKSALGIKIENVNPHITEAAGWLRGFFLCYCVFAGILIFDGMDWAMALIATGSLFWMATVFTRVLCETGLPFLNAHFLQNYLLRLIGYVFATPKGAAMTLHLQAGLFYDPRECMQPYTATAVQTGDIRGVNTGRILRIFCIMAVSAALFAFVVRGWGYYNWGGATAANTHAYNVTPYMMMNDITTVRSTLSIRDEMDIASHGNVLERLTEARPESDTVGFVLIGALLVILCGVARYRFTWWPIHPALFLIWNTYPVHMTYQIALIGWVIRMLIVRIGGGKVYQDIKPFFLGLIAGDMLASGLLISSGFIYYAVTGEVPKGYQVVAW